MAGVHQELIAAVRNYKVPPPAVKLLKQSPPLIISAITAGGKTTITGRIISQSDYRHVVTHTTRPIRQGEINGVNYWFVDDAEMLRLINSGAFIETQAVHGHTVYGTSLEAYRSVAAGGFKPLLVIDVQGIREIFEKIPEAQAYFLLPPNYETWMRRLDGRGEMPPTEKARRLQSARAELETVVNDNRFHLIVNRDTKSTAQEILSGPRTKNLPVSRDIALRLITEIDAWHS